MGRVKRTPRPAVPYKPLRKPRSRHGINSSNVQQLLSKPLERLVVVNTPPPTPGYGPVTSNDALDDAKGTAASQQQSVRVHDVSSPQADLDEQVITPTSMRAPSNEGDPVATHDDKAPAVADEGTSAAVGEGSAVTKRIGALYHKRTATREHGFYKRKPSLFIEVDQASQAKPARVEKPEPSPSTPKTRKHPQGREGVRCSTCHITEEDSIKQQVAKAIRNVYRCRTHKECRDRMLCWQCWNLCQRATSSQVARGKWQKKLADAVVGGAADPTTVVEVEERVRSAATEARDVDG